MLDIKFVRTNPDAVKENIKKKFQDEKIPMVDEVIEFDAKYRAAKTRCDELRAQRNKKSKEIGGLMAKGQKEEAEKIKAEVKAMADEMTKLEEDEKTFAEEVKNRMMVIPNIIDPSVPIGKDDSENVEIEKFGDPVVPDFEVPYHVDIMESFDGIDLDAARRMNDLRQRLLPEMEILRSVCRTSRFRIMLILWSPSTASTMLHAVPGNGFDRDIARLTSILRIPTAALPTIFRRS